MKKVIINEKQAHLDETFINIAQCFSAYNFYKETETNDYVRYKDQLDNVFLFNVDVKINIIIVKAVIDKPYNKKIQSCCYLSTYNTEFNIYKLEGFIDCLLCSNIR